MDPNSRVVLLGAAGAAGGEKIYVEDVFSTYLYTGNGSTQTITNGIDLAGKGGLVWLKSRSQTDNRPHYLVDTVRGATNTLYSNLTNASTVNSNGVASFSSNGFTIGAGGIDFNVNNSGSTYASWTFRKAAKFFDVVTWTGDGTTRSISHSLGATPGFIIVKRTSGISDWCCWHRSISTGNLSTNNLILLNSTSSAIGVANVIGAVSSTSFEVGASNSANASGSTYVAYLFAHDAGGFGDSGNESVIKCGSYIGTGAAGNFVDLGWEPQWLLIRRASSTGSWIIHDSMRGISTGGNDQSLFAHSSEAEASSNVVSLNPTGFTLDTTNGLWNDSFGSTYIYIAIRRGPMKTPTDATKVFSSIRATASTGSAITTDFPADASIYCLLAPYNASCIFQDRLRGYPTTSSTSGNYPILVSRLTSAESSYWPSYPYIWGADSNTSLKYGLALNGLPVVTHALRRAPGFFDVVAYTGTGSDRTVAHNLGVAPELIIVKARSATSNWPVYIASLGGAAESVPFLNTSDGAVFSNLSRFIQSPTDSVFHLGIGADVNFSGVTFIAYLFASCPGVSKVGSYTGTGTTLNIDCGFTNGARFVLIKRTDSTGDWYVWDTARGIISSNDPYLLFNSDAVEVTNTDYIDPLSSGFQISSTAPAAINASGGSFIFLAIA